METTKGIRIEKTGWSRAATGFRVSQECFCCSRRLVIRPGLGMSFDQGNHSWGQVRLALGPGPTRRFLPTPNFHLADLERRETR